MSSFQQNSSKIHMSVKNILIGYTQCLNKINRLVPMKSYKLGFIVFKKREKNVSSSNSSRQNKKKLIRNKNKNVHHVI